LRHNYATNFLCPNSTFFIGIAQKGVESVTSKKYLKITMCQTLCESDGGSYGFIDNLSFTYTGNQVTRIEDSSNDPTYNGAFNFVDGASQTNEYTYDANGNMTKDLNKNILSIQYNLLNLPQCMRLGNGNSAEYAYNAAGERLSTTYGDLTSGVTFYHSANYFYTYGPLYIFIDGGYITLNGSTPVYHYYVKDHLGSNRVVCNASGAVEQVNHYYPFGGLFGESTNASTQKYKYNGKELERVHGLDWYNYGARFMSPDVGRFITMDPMAEKYYSVSPYAYCGNNPINAIDVDGNFPLFPIIYKSMALLMEKKGTSNDMRETGYAMQHPINALKVGKYKAGSNNISTIAANFQINITKAANMTNGKEGDFGNAIRHTLWQSIITKELGIENAKRIGDAHEDKTNLDLKQRLFDSMSYADTVVDLLNNSIGREIGSKYGNLSNQELARKVVEEFYKNGLWTAFTNKEGNIIIQRTRINDSQYNAAIDEINKKNNLGLNK